MKKVYVVTDCWREGDHDCYAYVFATLAEARAKFDVIVDDFKSCHDMNEWQECLTDTKTDCHFRNEEEGWFDSIHIKELILEDSSNEIFTVKVDDGKENELYLEIFPTEIAACEFLKDYADEYVDEYCSTVMTSDEDSNVKLVSGGDFLHGYLNGSYCVSGAGNKFVDFKCKDVPIDLTMDKEFIQRFESVTA